jgi:hypothetical protein
MKCANASPYVQNASSYTAFSFTWYAAYSRTMADRNVQVPNVRALSGVTGDVLL